jgi:hypothetical protein
MTRRRSIEERLAIYSKPAQNGCIEWTGHLTPDGYGHMRVQGKYLMAHRAAMEVAGYDLTGMQADHMCRNRACVNVTHLEAVTPRVNALRGLSPAAQNARKIACIRGHRFTTENTYWTPAGGRQCRACGRIRTAAAAARKRAKATAASA